MVFDAETTRLIQLYIVGVFVSFNLSQLGMILHWTRLLKTETGLGQASSDVPVAVINTVGLAFTAVVLVVVLVTKFLTARGSHPGDGHLLHDHERHPKPLRPRPRS